MKKFSKDILRGMIVKGRLREAMAYLEQFPGVMQYTSQHDIQLSCSKWYSGGKKEVTDMVDSRCGLHCTGRLREAMAYLEQFPEAAALYQKGMDLYQNVPSGSSTL